MDGWSAESNAADMLGRPESHISLFPTNSGISTKFAEGIRSVTYRTEDGEVEAGADFQAKKIKVSTRGSSGRVTSLKIDGKTGSGIFRLQ